MRDLLPWLRLLIQRKRRLAIGALLIFLTLLSGMGLLALSGWFITATAITGLLLSAGTAVMFDVYVPGGAIRAFALTRTVARYGERVYNHDTVLRLLADIRVHMFHGLAAATGFDRAQKRGADWLARMTSDVDAMDTLFLRLIAPTGLALMVTLLVVVLSAFLFGMTMAGVVASMLGLAFLVATLLLYGRTRHLAHRQITALQTLRSEVIEHIEGLAELTAAGARGRHRHHLEETVETWSRDQGTVDQRNGWHTALSGLLINCTVVATLWLGLASYQAALISGPVLVLLPLAVLAMNEIYAALPDAFARLGGTVAAAGRLNDDQHADVHHLAPAVGCPVSPTPNTSSVIGITWDCVSAGYRTAQPVIQTFSCVVSPGQKVGIVGQSGSGKSTLAHMAAGLIEPTSGSCLGVGSGRTNGGQKLPHSWLQQVAYLTQHTRLFDDTLKANVLLGNPNATDAELWQILETVCLTDLVRQLPNGLDTWLGAYGRQLSGGEARRVALARVLIKDAGLVILDEPFAGLDTNTRARIRERMQQRLAGKTVIGFAHQPAALPFVDRVITLAGS